MGEVGVPMSLLNSWYEQQRAVFTGDECRPEVNYGVTMPSMQHASHGLQHPSRIVQRRGPGYS